MQYSRNNSGNLFNSVQIQRKATSFIETYTNINNSAAKRHYRAFTCSNPIKPTVAGEFVETVALSGTSGTVQSVNYLHIYLVDIRYSPASIKGNLGCYQAI
jgi:hypothetical protein